jgi:hypothetical protein
MTAHQNAFCLPVSWDIAVVAVERAIEQTPSPFDLVDRTNGLYRLKQRDGIRLIVEYRMETPNSTIVVLHGKRGRIDSLLGKGTDIDQALQTFRAAILDHVAKVRPAA